MKEHPYDVFSIRIESREHEGEYWHGDGGDPVSDLDSAGRFTRFYINDNVTIQNFLKAGKVKLVVQSTVKPHCLIRTTKTRKPEYWLALNRGMTTERHEAHVYTVEEAEKVAERYLDEGKAELILLTKGSEPKPKPKPDPNWSEVW